MSETLTFSIERKKIPVVLTKENGTEITGYIQEMDGANRDAYLNNVTSRTDEDGNVKDFKGFHANLVQRCLFLSLEENEEAKRVNIDYCQNELPAQVLTSLFEACQTLNALNEQGEEEAKNG